MTKKKNDIENPVKKDPYSDIPEEYRPKQKFKLENTTSNTKRWGTLFLVVLILSALSFMLASCVTLFMGSGQVTGNVAVIPINGAITSFQGDIFSDQLAVSGEIITMIDQVEKDTSIEAVIFEIDSPGGAAAATEEIVSAIDSMQKPKIALIRSLGASGAYWISASTDHIIANPLSITGSIGVIGSYIEFSGLLDKYNITYQRLVGGEYKDTGTPFRKLEDDERDIMQEKIDLIHEYFFRDVLRKRTLPEDKIEEIRSGLFFLGTEALELGLVDQLGHEKDAIAHLEEELNATVELRRYGRQKSFFERLLSAYSQRGYSIGKGIGNELLNGQATIRT